MAMSLSLYHYTDRGGASGILRTMLVRSSEDPNASVYLTAIPPVAGRTRVLINNYEGEKREAEAVNKAEFYFAFQLVSLPAARRLDGCDRDVWVHPGDIELERTSFRCGRTEDSEEEAPGEDGFCFGKPNEMVTDREET